jgi:cell division protein ZapA
MQQRTQVQIFGQVLNIRGGDDPERVREIAARVDAKMNEISDRGAAVDSYRVALLAAIELANEAARAEEELAALRETIRARSRRIEGLLEETSAFAERPAAD